MSGKYRYRFAKHVICNHPGCRRITTGRFCTEHSRAPAVRSPEALERDKFLDTAAWKRCRAAKLAIDSDCEICAAKGKFEPAIDVDHIKPRRTHPELALDLRNLQSLCERCHGQKTRRGE